MAGTKEEWSTTFESYASINDLSPEDRALVEQAKVGADRAYAPYSNFHVGAAALLSNGEVVLASNKENASFPAGVCAERNALNYASDQFPDSHIESIAVIAEPEAFKMKEPVMPCGICRQVLCETERVQNKDIRVILASRHSGAKVFHSAASLLPFHFYVPKLKRESN